MKKLRNHFPGVRFYVVGEYGDKTQRPHYHYALFGAPSCPLQSPPTKECKCQVCSKYSKIWGKGRIHAGSFTPESAQYVSGYVTKKMTSPDDPRLEGRFPEFSRQSLRPALGYPFADEIGKQLLKYNKTWDDIPSSIKIGGRSWPLDRTMINRIKTHLPEPENYDAIQEHEKRMRSMYLHTPNAPKEILRRAGKNLSIASSYKNTQKILDVEAKLKFKKGKSL
jgi:hypothetical protein